MNPSERSSPAFYFGHVKNGVVVLDANVTLREGLAVRVEPVNSAQEAGLTRLEEMQQRFAEWTAEDAELSDAEADLLSTALEKSRGLGLRSPALD